MEKRALKLGVGIRKYSIYYSIQLPYLHNIVFDKFIGLHSGSVQQLDLYIRLSSMQYLIMLYESGRSESFPRLRADKDLWIHDIGDHIRLLLLIL